jgi:uncharacterized protein (TIGR02268 family)
LFQRVTSPFALAFLLLSLTATAQAASVERSAPRSVVLTGKVGEAPVLSLAPGTITLLILDAPIVLESVEVEGRARFAVVDVDDRIITLSLAVPLGPGEQLALKFSYREGFPSSAVFLLTGQPGMADEVVKVRRPPQTVEACRAELSATRERCEAQARELEELKARPAAMSPAAVALAGLVDSHGMSTRNLDRDCEKTRGELLAGQCKGLGAATWSVVVLEVSNTGPEPWTPAWAEVAPAAVGEPRRARVVHSVQATIPPGGTVNAAVEVEMPVRKPDEWLQAPHSVRVCDESGHRCLFVPKVWL